jgi:uncharacterized protein YegJ (DUF2314 family)
MPSKYNKKKPSPAEGLPVRGWLGLGAVVAALVGLVVWSLPKDDAAQTAADGGATPAASGTPEAGPGAKVTGSLERLPEASCELAVVTDKPEEQVKALANAEAIGKLLDVRHCGLTCDAVKKTLADAHTELEVMKADDFILPPAESFDAIAPGLTPEERERTAKSPLTLVVRTKEPPSVDQPAARACLAAAGAAAEALGGFVYDEAGRRIETPAQWVSHAITTPLGQPVFTPRQIGIQVYRQDDGTARLLTLGMIRYGTPDFIARGASMGDATRIAHVVNAIAAKAAAMKTELPFTVTIADVVKVSGLPASALAKDPSASKPIKLDVVEAERTEGDPDNDIVELVPQTKDGATAEGWADVIGTLFGEAPSIVRAPESAAELEKVATKAKKDLPDAIKRWKAGDGELFVKGPFDAGDAGTEYMWIEATGCDAKTCNGILANDPGYASNLAQGKPASIAKDKTADWMLRLKDGGTAGGDSIRVLTKKP